MFMWDITKINYTEDVEVMLWKKIHVSLKLKKTHVAIKISDKTGFKARKKEVHELKVKGQNFSEVLNA